LDNLSVYNAYPLQKIYLMKKNYSLIALFCVLAYVVLSGNSAGPGSISSLERTGVTSTYGCGGTGCHGMVPSSVFVGTTEVLDSTGAVVTSYIPYHTYTFRITAVNTSSYFLPKFGFQLTAVKDGTSTSTGTLLATPGTHTVSVTGVQVAEHSAPIWGAGTGGLGTVYQVSVKWKAPVPLTGDVRVNDVLNAVNYSGTANDSDKWNPAGPPLILPETVSPILGPSNFCVGTTFVSYTNATPGGVWVSSATGVASVSPTGSVYAAGVGMATISYIATTGIATKLVSVSPTPAPITGPTIVCQSSTITLANAVPGGMWSSWSATIATIGSSSGIVTGVSSGLTTIYYSIGPCMVNTNVLVKGVTPITGTDSVCVGDTVMLTNATGGGTWSSSSGAVGMGSTGMATGMAGGTATISYTDPAGCVSTMSVTVNTPPTASVSGSTAGICPGDSIILSGGPSGGTWVSADSSIATVSATGAVTGVATGTATIMYITTNGCGSDSAMIPATILHCTTANAPITNQHPIVEIYPNPSAGEFSLSVNSVTENTAHVIINDIVGRRVYESVAYTNKAVAISLHQPAGIYFACVAVGSKKYFIKLVIE
jgi:uncharacterized protein YjdB